MSKVGVATANVDHGGGHVIADKGFAGEEFEESMAELGAIFLRPDRKDEEPRYRQVITLRGRNVGTTDAVSALTRCRA